MGWPVPSSFGLLACWFVLPDSRRRLRRAGRSLTAIDGVAIVTGAAHGIGLAIAQRLDAAGASVVAVDVDGDELGKAPLPSTATRLVKDVAEDR